MKSSHESVRHFFLVAGIFGTSVYSTDNLANLLEYVMSSQIPDLRPARRPAFVAGVFLSRSAVLAVALLASTAGAQGMTPPTSPTVAVQEFLRATSEGDDETMARLFGTPANGSFWDSINRAQAGEQEGIREEVRHRMCRIADHLAHASSEVVNEERNGSEASTVNIRLKLEERTTLVPFQLARTGQGTWLIGNIGLTGSSTAPPGVRCGRLATRRVNSTAAPNPSSPAAAPVRTAAQALQDNIAELRTILVPGSAVGGDRDFEFVRRAGFDGCLIAFEYRYITSNGGGQVALQRLDMSKASRLVRLLRVDQAWRGTAWPYRVLIVAENEMSVFPLSFTSEDPRWNALPSRNTSSVEFGFRDSA